MKRFLLPSFIVIFLFYIYQNDLLNQYILKYNDFKNIENSSELKSYDYLSNIDGDTIKILGNDGKIITIRMIGIDAPESSKLRRGYVECYGNEAKLHLKEILEGYKKVFIETDLSQGIKDKYGRMLAYVFIDKININEKMLKDGYAFEYTFKKPYKYQSQFKNAQLKAEEDKIGLWGSICNGKRKN